MLLTALEKAGVVDYLVKQSEENPTSCNARIAKGQDGLKSFPDLEQVRAWVKQHKEKK